jgi:hypothetical protein
VADRCVFVYAAMTTYIPSDSTVIHVGGFPNPTNINVMDGGRCTLHGITYNGPCRILVKDNIVYVNGTKRQVLSSAAPITMPPKKAATTTVRGLHARCDDFKVWCTEKYPKLPMARVGEIVDQFESEMPPINDKEKKHFDECLARQLEDNRIAKAQREMLQGLGFITMSGPNDDEESDTEEDTAALYKEYNEKVGPRPRLFLKWVRENHPGSRESQSTAILDEFELKFPATNPEDKKEFDDMRANYDTHKKQQTSIDNIMKMILGLPGPSPGMERTVIVSGGGGGPAVNTAARVVADKKEKKKGKKKSASTTTPAIGKRSKRQAAAVASKKRA